MIPYVVTFILSLTFLYLASIFAKRKNIILSIICQVVAVIIPCLLAAMRNYSIGTDTKGYIIERYNYTEEHNDLLSYLRDPHIGEDYAYYSMVFISAKIFKNFFWDLFFTQLLTIIPLLVAFKGIGGKDNKWRAVLIGMTLYYLYSYHLSLNMARQSIALSFIVLSFVRYRQKRYKETFINVVIAILFHKSSLIIIPVYLFFFAIRNLKEKWLKVIYATMLLVLVFVSTFFTQIVKIITLIFPQIISNVYLDVFADEAKFFWSGLIFWYTLVILIVVCLKKMNVLKMANNREIILFIILIVCIPIISSKIQYSERIMYFAQYIIVYYYITFFGSHLINKNNRHILVGAVVVMFVVYWSYCYIYLDIGDTVPYLLRMA